jgi:uncharacterized protein YegL
VDLTPEGPSLLDPAKGPVAHVILLLDVSASMDASGKYPVLLDALERMLQELRTPGAAPVLLSVVVFAYGAQTLFRDVVASTLEPAEVIAKIDSSPLLFGRYTDVGGALKRAGKIAVDQLRANRGMPTRVYILTDGKPQDLQRTRHVWRRVGALPVDVDCLAFGDDANVGLLQEIISGGRGGTVKQVREDTLADAFDRIAEVAQRIVSNRAIVDVALAPGVIGRNAWRFRPGRHRFGEKSFVGGSHFRTDIGCLESGRTYSLLFELRLPETQSDRTDVGRVSVRLRGVGAPRVFRADVSVPRTASADLPDADPVVVAARDVVASLTENDTETQLRALRARHRLYVAERRDPRLIALVERAIGALESRGSLESLSDSERATLRSHTVTVGSLRFA